MRLVSVYERLHGPNLLEQIGQRKELLWQLLKEREPHECISHKRMPTRQEHVAFVNSRPYFAWYIAEADGHARGAVYLSHQREIGVGILKGHRGHGYALDAVSALMRKHPGSFLANINPANQASIRLFAKLGFSGPIQHTYAREA